MSTADTIALLRALDAGDPSAFDELFGRLYGELRDIAHHRLVSFRPTDTLNTTALVHEAYVKLVDQGSCEPQDRAHFLALASRAMRFVLIDYARSRAAGKRGGGAAAVTLDRVQIAADERAHDLIALDAALTDLAHADPRLAQVVELRFFGGLSYDDIAAVTSRSVPTAKRDWARARAWLYRSMQESLDV
jgi:RNA polymerase sigma factor (TIGR02999 family)